MSHLSEQLAVSVDKVTVQTKHGRLTGARATNGAIAFLEVPYALPPRRFEDPEPLPEDYVYEDKEYIHESAYAAQPGNDGQAAGMPIQDKLGLGHPSENPLFLNIVIPPSWSPGSEEKKYPVKIYIHGGFLQFGSPHSLGSQAQYVAAERDEIWVNIGYRLSAFGFLACDEPRVDGNFGFKDQWLALEWVQANITSFGGDVSNIQVTGLSAGAHSVHQLLHHASRLPPGKGAPFQSALLHSNAIITSPKTPQELRPQFTALCTALGVDPTSPDALKTLRDPAKVKWQDIVSAIEEEKLGEHGTFRGCMDGDWLAVDPDPMRWQRQSPASTDSDRDSGGGLADGLRRAGVRSVVVGDLKEEWYLYAIAHPITCEADIRTNLLRYYPAPLVDAFLRCYPPLNASVRADPEACARRFGEVLSDGQVYLPVRILARDLALAGFPVVRYDIRWTPEQVREATKGYVTHATDRPLWSLRTPILKPDQVETAHAWISAVEREVRAAVEAAEVGRPLRGVREVLTLHEDRTIGWVDDPRYDEVMRLAKVLPSE